MKKNDNNINNPATFVIPHWAKDMNTIGDLNKTINSVYKQTDTNWKIVIVDDKSPSEEAKNYLKKLEKESNGKIKLILKDQNGGPGLARNSGIQWAKENNSPFILFLDADDISHERRLEEARKIFETDKNADVIYSPFIVIDENDKIVQDDKQKWWSGNYFHLENTHPKGPNAWIDIATDSSYINLTSATSVRTDLAVKEPFPNERVSEDYHTWLRYSASGDSFVYCKDTPTLYRIPQNTESASRAREDDFTGNIFRVNEAGFKEAFNLAVQNKKIDKSRKTELFVRFYVKMAKTAKDMKNDYYVNEQLEKARTYSKDLTKKYLEGTNLFDQYWKLKYNPKLLERTKSMPYMKKNKVVSRELSI